MVMEKEAGPPSVPGPARLWVELQATVNQVRCKRTMCVPQRCPNRNPDSCLVCAFCAPAALRARSFVCTAPVVGIAGGPQRGSETLTVWGTEGECGKAKSEKASQ